jgi:hypothetical protein
MLTVGSVLYQRGIYPPEDFKVVKKYGLNVLVTTDDEVKNYIKRIMGQLSRTAQFPRRSKQILIYLSRLDERWQNLQIGHDNRLQGDWRGLRAMAIRRPYLRKTHISQSSIRSRRQRKYWVSEPLLKYNHVSNDL